MQAEYLAEAVERRCPGSAGRLWRALRGKYALLRNAAIELLPLVLGPKALPILAEALRSASAETRAAGARGMVRLGRAALPELEQALPVVTEASGALVDIGGPEALAVLARSWKWIQDPMVALFLPDRERRSWYLLRLDQDAPKRPMLPVEMSLPLLVSLLRITADPAAAPFCMTALALGKGIPQDFVGILASMKRPDADTVLATFLRGSNAKLRRDAALGLGRLADPRVVPVLARDLRPKIPDAFLRSAEALALTGRSEALSVLLPHVKWTGAIGRAAISALGVLLRERGRFLRGPGAKALREKALRLLRGLARSKPGHAKQARPQTDPRRWWALAALGLARDREALDQGLALVRSKDRTEALAGCMALDGQGRDGKAARALVSLLDASDPRLAACAAWVLRDSDRQQALLRAIADPRPMVSRNAAAALAQGRFSLSALRKAARSLDEVVRTAALVALARRRAVSFQRLVQALARADDAWRPVILAAMAAWDQGRTRKFLRDMGWRFQRLGVDVPSWMLLAELDVWGRIFHRPEENFVMLALDGTQAAGRPVSIRPKSGLPFWWFSGPNGLLLQTGLPAGWMEVTLGPGYETASRSRRKHAARPGSRGGGKFRGASR